MDFFYKNNFTGNGFLTLDRLTPSEKKFDLLFRDKEKKVVGCGLTNFEIKDSVIEFTNWWNLYYDCVKDENYQTMNMDYTFVFIIGNNHMYFAEKEIIYPIVNKVENISLFIDFINKLNSYKEDLSRFGKSAAEWEEINKKDKK
jgi:hypothetical protein